MMKTKLARTVAKSVTESTTALNNVISQQTSSVACVETPATWLETAQTVNVAQTGAMTNEVPLLDARLAKLAQQMLSMKSINLLCKNFPVVLLLAIVDLNNALKLDQAAMTIVQVALVEIMSSHGSAVRPVHQLHGRNEDGQMLTVPLLHDRGLAVAVAGVVVIMAITIKLAMVLHQELHLGINKQHLQVALQTMAATADTQVLTEMQAVTVRLKGFLHLRACQHLHLGLVVCIKAMGLQGHLLHHLLVMLHPHLHRVICHHHLHLAHRMHLNI